MVGPFAVFAHYATLSDWAFGRIGRGLWQITRSFHPMVGYTGLVFWACGEEEERWVVQGCPSGKHQHRSTLLGWTTIPRGELGRSLMSLRGKLVCSLWRFLGPEGWICRRRNGYEGC